MAPDESSPLLTRLAYLEARVAYLEDRVASLFGRPQDSPLGDLGGIGPSTPKRPTQAEVTAATVAIASSRRA